MKKIFYGLILVAAAVLILLGSLGVPLGFIGTLPVVDLVLSVILLIFTISVTIHGIYWAIPFPLAGIFMTLESEIAAAAGLEDKNIISNWIVLLCALLIAIGTGLISSRLRRTPFVKSRSRSVRLSAQTKYIDCKNFSNYRYSVYLGSGSVYFENADKYAGGGVLNIKCELGNLEIHVPSEWWLATDIETTLGNTEVEQGGNESGPLLTIKGICNKANVQITFT